MSFFAKLWRVIRVNTPARYVGRDLEGNKFYEKPNAITGGRMKRTVKYRHPDDMWHYIGGGKRLAIQWSAWLSHTRVHPPTVNELEADAARQQRVQFNAAMIEAKEREERQKASLIEAGSPFPKPEYTPDTPRVSEPPAGAPNDTRSPPEGTKSEPPSPFDQVQPPEIQSWTPAAAPRSRGH
ncbi:hypothetical protein HGRIS_011628 [Hohenbuehelia grisea]|uniref:NADH dehydrogenase [ubiquinone] 1 alpha subcomplex subunit 12 n=1 Tax=Hohenbuehelia grisea TaxID=104357 RepID=A0ABR3JWH6_9AGAR